MRFFRLAILVIGVALLLSPSLKATTVDFSVCGNITSALGVGGVCPGDTKTPTLTYSTGGVTVIATGELVSGGTTNLFVKHGGANETGLGTTIDVNNEIGPREFVSLDMSNLVSQGIFSGTLILESLQAGEGYTICTDTSVGTLSASCSSGGAGSLTTPPVPVSWTSSAHFLGITDLNAGNSAANILIDGLTTPTLIPPPPPVPEPATLTLFGFGIAGLAGLRRKLVKL